ncbi:MAG: hypothetical protein ABI700_09010 [Chloroflexota bacterium]
MSPPKRLDDWIDEDEYPDDRDVEEFGDESPVDYDPRTIGYVGWRRRGFWTTGRIILSIICLLIVAAILLPLISSVLH